MRVALTTILVRSLLKMLCAFSATASIVVSADDCAAPGADGNSSMVSVVNTYWVGEFNPPAGATNFTLGTSVGAANSITPGDLLLFIQMQDSNINSNNNSNYGDGVASDPANGYTNLRRTGRYEFVRSVAPVAGSGGALSIASPIIYDYANQPANNNRGQRTYQIVRVPQYENLTLTSNLTAQAWDGVSGGIVAIDVAGTLDLNGFGIDVSGKGFRGGGARASTTGSGSNNDYRTPFSNGANGSKGEGTAGTPRLVFDGSNVIDNGIEGYPNGSFGRGAPGNAGGGGTDGNPSSNDQNTGGGGGGNYEQGGRGGHSWCPGGPSVCPQTGGYGGDAVANIGVDRITLGGGGGAGTTNNATGTPGGGIASSGAAGGGIIIIRAGRIIGTGTLNADGATANQTVDNDGSGGGGAGGTIIINTLDSSGASIVATVRGGDGGSNGNSTPHGPGGGGSGGFVAVSTGLGSTITVITTPGNPGTTEGNPAPFNSNYGATGGFPGFGTTVFGPDIPGVSGGFECIVGVEKSFTPNNSTTNTPVRLKVEITNPNPDLPLSNVALVDSYPANLQNAPVPNATSTCGGTIIAAAGAQTLGISGATIASGASCDLEVDVVGLAAGSYLNEIDSGEATGEYLSRTFSNLLPTSDSLTITEALDVTKSVAVVSDPFDQVLTPHTIPGAYLEYTIVISNPGTTVVSDGTVQVSDAIPANTHFINDPLLNGLPVAFDDGAPSSGMTLQPTGVAFSNNNGASYLYTPSTGVDEAVTNLQVTFDGSILPGTSAALRFRVELQ